MNLKVSKIQISGFRGIPHTLTLDLQPEHGKSPTSLILTGDNGVGKSSIVEAFEFALQARIARKKEKLFREYSPMAQSLARNGRCQISVDLTDATTITRRIYQDQNGEWKTNIRPHPRFAISPFVLRRADILKFWNIPDAQRQTVFFDYMLENVDFDTPIEIIEEKIERLRQQYKLLVKELKSAIEQLAQALSVQTSRVKVGAPKFERSLKNRIREIEKKQGETQKVYVEHLVDIVRSLAKKIRESESEAARLQLKISPLPNKLAVREVVANASASITNAFLAVSPAISFANSVELVLGEKESQLSLSLMVNLKNGETAHPQNIFSEANLDLLAIIVFLAFAKESAKKGQARFLILDDVLQSVDAAIRVCITDYILDEFKDWQMVYTVHDRLWLEQLRELFRQKNIPFVEGEILKWNFEDGPLLVMGSKDIDTSLVEALAKGDIVAICAQAGLLLEKICNKLSYALPIPVTRRKGDKYTLGDLWPGIVKSLSRTNCKQAVDDVNRWIHLRNLVGAHYNEWAQSLSGYEANLFGEAVLRLLLEVRCPDCNYWIERSTTPNIGKPLWSCRCGNRQIID